MQLFRNIRGLCNISNHNSNRFTYVFKGLVSIIQCHNTSGTNNQFFLANIHLRMINVPSTESYIILFQLTQLLGFLVLLEQLATKPGSTSTTKILSFTCPIGFKFKVLFHSSLKHIVMKMPLTSTSVFLSKLACAYGCSFL